MRLQNKTIAILIAEGVEDYEYFVPLMRLQEEGAKVLSAGIDLKTFKGKNGLAITPDTTIESLKAKDLFALIIPGGWAPDKLRRHDVVKNIVHEMDAAKKIVRWDEIGVEDGKILGIALGHAVLQGSCLEVVPLDPGDVENAKLGALFLELANGLGDNGRGLVRGIIKHLDLEPVERIIESCRCFAR